MKNPAKNTICLWYASDAEGAMMQMQKIDIATIEAARRGSR